MVEVQGCWVWGFGFRVEWKGCTFQDVGCFAGPGLRFRDSGLTFGATCVHASFRRALTSLLRPSATTSLSLSALSLSATAVLLSRTDPPPPSNAATLPVRAASHTPSRSFSFITASARPSSNPLLASRACFAFQGFRNQDLNWDASWVQSFGFWPHRARALDLPAPAPSTSAAPPPALFPPLPTPSQPEHDRAEVHVPPHRGPTAPSAPQPPPFHRLRLPSPPPSRRARPFPRAPPSPPQHRGASGERSS